MNKHTESSTEKSESWQMFNRIAPRYDFVNRLLSFRMDIGWRKRLAKFLPSDRPLHVLDLATGTGDVLLSLCRYCPNIEKAEGIDLADNMLDVGRIKAQRKNLEDKITLQHGDAHKIPFKDNTFDAVTMSFGIRNVSDPELVLMEIFRVLKPSGQALILEFSTPRNALVRTIHLFYLRQIVPFIGWMFTGNYHAYKYLNRTIESFPYGQAFCAMMDQKAFMETKSTPLFFGTASIYSGVKKS